jgi:hypothetical protein
MYIAIIKMPIELTPLVFSPLNPRSLPPINGGEGKLMRHMPFLPPFMGEGDLKSRKGELCSECRHTIF